MKHNLRFGMFGPDGQFRVQDISYFFSCGSNLLCCTNRNSSMQDLYTMTLIATRPTEYPCKRFMCSNFQQTMGHLAKLELLLLKHEDIGRRG